MYTAMMGGYESLNEQPTAVSSGIPFICLTDDPDLRSDTWRVEVIEPPRPSDSIRSARAVKILGHPIVDEFDLTLWIDNTVLLRTDPHHLLDEWLSEVDVAIPGHSFRERLADEFEAVVLAGLDDPARVYEQAWAYLQDRPALLEEPPLWTGIMARRRSAEVELFQRRWFDDVLRYSLRDQLSVSAALARTAGLAWRRIELDNHASAMHQWPLATQRDRRDLRRSQKRWLQPRALEVRELERRIGEVEAALDDALVCLHAMEEQSLALVYGINAREAMLEAQAGHLESLSNERAAVRAELDAVLASRSWRAGRALAAATRPFRRRLRA